MKHFLITRFNLKSEIWTHSKNGLDILSKAWLDDRFELFETYCLPSVANQSNQNFTWLILFDIDTPKVFKTQIESLIKGYSNFTVLYIDGFKELTTSVSAFIKNNIAKEDKYIITTRLDNDDVLHKDFIKTIQAHYVEKDNCLIDLQKGYQLIIEDQNHTVKLFYSKLNPFLSVIEASNNFGTIVSKKHNEWLDAALIEIKSQPMWIQLIHAQNLINANDYSLKWANNFKPEAFSLQLNQPINTKKVAYLNAIYFPYRLFIKLKYGLKKWLKG